MNDVRWTRGGRRGGGADIQNIYVLNLKASFLPVKTSSFNHAQLGPSPPTSTSRPPDIIHVMNAPRPSPFFAGLPLPCIIVNANGR